MSIYQLDLFEKFDETQLLKNELKEMKESYEFVRLSSDKVRRGIFARHNILEKKLNELTSRLDIIEKFICKEKK